MALEEGPVRPGDTRIDVQRLGRPDLAQRADQDRPIKPGLIPAETAPLLGRDEILAFLQKQLLVSRLVTLTGSAGVGKTAIATALARRVRDREALDLSEFDVRWASLAINLDNIDLESVDIRRWIDRRVAEALRIQNLGDQPDALRIMADLETPGPPILLVLDNCEQIVGDVSDFVHWLLDSVTADQPRRLRIIATTREQLAWPGEHVELIKPLPYPSSEDPLDTGMSWPALELFLRARRGLSAEVPAAQLDMAAKIVRALGGNPRAIRHMAESWRQLPLAELLRALEDDSPASPWDTAPARAGSRGVRPSGRRVNARRRQHVMPRVLKKAFETSMRASDWTGQLTAVLARLSILDSFDIDTAIAICSGPDVSEHDVRGLVHALVDKSWLRVDFDATVTPARYYFEESNRWFAYDLLVDRYGEQEEERLWLRHLDFFFGLAASLGSRWYGEDEIEVVERARADRTNFHAAMTTGCGLGTPEHVLKAVAIVDCFSSVKAWHWWNSLAEGQHWLMTVAQAARVLGERDLTRLGVISLASWFAFCQGREDEGQRLLDEIVAFYPPDLPETPSYVSFTVGFRLMMVNQDRRSIDYFVTAARRYQQEYGEVMDNREHLPEQSRDVLVALAGLCPGGAVMALQLAALAAAYLGTNEQALHHTEVFMARAQQVRAPSAIEWAQVARALALAWHSGPRDLPKAISMIQRAAVRFYQTGDGWSLLLTKDAAICIQAEALAHAVKKAGTIRARDRAEARRLARACGSSRKLHHVTDYRMAGMGPFLTRHRAAVDIIRGVLDDTTFRQVEKAGFDLPYEQARLAGTLLDPQYQGLAPADAADPPAVPGHIRDGWEGENNPRAHRIVYYLASGLTGREIAAKEGISESNVDGYGRRAVRNYHITGKRSEFKGYLSAIRQLWRETYDTPLPGLDPPARARARR